MSRLFRDADDREWSVKVTVSTIEKVREIGIDLGDVTGQTMKRIVSDDVLLVRAMWLVCESQADERGVTPAQFGEGLFGDALDRAYEALRGALDDFFPSRKRQFWRKMMEADEDRQQTAMQAILDALEDPQTKANFGVAVQDRVKLEVEKSLIQLQSAIASRE